MNKNWVELSRDLHGIPRRLLLDFDLPEERRHDPFAARLGWALWGVVFGLTVAVYRWRGRDRGPTGLAAGFLFLGAYLGCYRFMYYDVLLSAVGVIVLWADPRGLFGWATGHLRSLPFGPRWVGRVLAPPVLVVALLVGCENLAVRYQPRATAELAGYTFPPADAGGARRTPRVTAEIGYYHPWETLLVLGLWGWCGWRLAWGGRGIEKV